VDNSSSGNSVDRIKSTFPNLNLYKNKTNQGFAKANNLAICRSQGRYILLLNPDTIVSSDTFSEMVRFMDSDGQIGVSTCLVKLVSGEIDDASHRGFPTLWNAFCYFSGLARVFPNNTVLNGYHLGYRDLDKAHEIDSCVGAFMMIRREAGEKLNWLDEDYFWYGEDLDFCYRVKMAGFKVMYNPKTQIIHYKGAASGLKTSSKTLTTATFGTKLMATRSRYEVMKIFYRKHYLHKYPSFITSLVFLAINIKKYLGLIKLKS